MKFLIVLVMLFVMIGCETRRMDVGDTTIEDCGKLKVGINLYLKKVVINEYDKVYFFVDEKDNLISGASASYMQGKVQKSVSTVIVVNPNEKGE
jgi:hypothetical protein